MKIIGAVQARLGSTRLPRKIMKMLPYGDWREESMLRFLLDRLTRSHYLDRIVVACPESDFGEIINEGYIADDPTPVDFRHYPVPDDDLVARHAAVAGEFDADLIVRVPSDNPFVDPFVVDMAIQHAYASGFECYSTLVMDAPSGYVDGLGAEVYPRQVIEALDVSVRAPIHDREHPQTCVNLKRLTATEWRHGPMTFDVNTPADLDRMRRIASFMVERHGAHFTARHLNQAPHEVLA